MRKVMLVLPSLGAGGAERVMLTLADHLDKAAFNLDLVVLDGRGHFSGYSRPGVRVIDMGCRRVRQSWRKLIRFIWRNRPHVVLSTLGHLNILMAMIKPLFPHTLFIGRESNIPSLKLESFSHPLLFSFLYRVLYPRFDIVVCQSRCMQEDLRQSFGVPSVKLRVIHNPVDVKKVQSLADEGPNPFPRRSRRILAVGRMEKQKQFHLLPDLLGRFRDEEDVRLTILGDGSLRKRIESGFAEAGLQDRADLLGIQSNPFLFMKHADVLVLTSAHEGFPNVVLEANACGLPVVAFRCPGVTEEIIRDGVNGWLVEQGDLNGMACCIRQVFSRPPDSRAIAEHVRLHYGVDAVVERYAEVLRG
jgi:glycosyltransferase involved in cell wall biosynthesis